VAAPTRYQLLTRFRQGIKKAREISPPSS